MNAQTKTKTQILEVAFGWEHIKNKGAFPVAVFPSLKGRVNSDNDCEICSWYDGWGVVDLSCMGQKIKESPLDGATYKPEQMEALKTDITRMFKAAEPAQTLKEVSLKEAKELCKATTTAWIRSRGYAV